MVSSFWLLLSWWCVLQDTEQQHTAKSQEHMEKQALVLSRVHHILLNTQTALHMDSSMMSQTSTNGNMRPELQLEAFADGVLDHAQKLAASHKQNQVSVWVTKPYAL